MGGRARNGTPLGMRLHLNTDTGLYETEEDEIIYCIPFSLMNELKREYKHLYSVEVWYSKLSIEDKKSIVRRGLADDTERYNDGGHAE